MNNPLSALLAAPRERSMGSDALPMVVPAVVTGGLLTALIALAVSSKVGAIAAIGIAVLALAVVSLGLERAGEAFVLLGALLVPMNDLHTSGAASFVTAADAAFLLGFGLMLPDLMRRPLRLPTTFVIGGAGVFVIALFSSLLSEAPFGSLNITSRLVVGAFGIAVLFSWWSPGLKKVVVVAWAYVLGNVISAGYSFIDGTVTSEGRRIGLTEHPNIFGLCALLGLSLVPFLITQTPRQYRWVPVVMGLVCLWSIWTSGSRGALAALLVVAVVYPLLSRSVLAGLGLLAVFAVFMIYSERLLNESSSANSLGRLLGQGSSSGSDTAREQLAATAFDQFLAHPILGVGLADLIAAHIIYLQILAGLGVFGLAAYALALWTTVRPAVVLTPPLSLLALPALSYVTLGWVTPVLWDRYIWVALALSLLAGRLAEDIPPDEEPSADTGQPARARAIGLHRSTP